MNRIENDVVVAKIKPFGNDCTRYHQSKAALLNDPCFPDCTTLIPSGKGRPPRSRQTGAINALQYDVVRNINRVGTVAVQRRHRILNHHLEDAEW